MKGLESIREPSDMMHTWITSDEERKPSSVIK